MGFINKAVTKRVVQPYPVVVGSWVKELAPALPFFERENILALAALRALFMLDPGKAQSYYMRPNETRTTAMDRAVRESPSVIKVDAALGLTPPRDRLTCAAAEAAVGFTVDWQLQAVIDGATEPHIEVAAASRLDDAVKNKDLLEEVRALYGRVLTEGPGSVEVTDQPPAMEGLVQVGPCPFPKLSLFASDRFLALPAGFADGARLLDLPVGGAEAVANAAREASMPSAESDAGIATISLAGGRTGVQSSLAVVKDARREAIVLRLGGDGEMSRLRTFRAHAVHLSLLADRLPDRDAAGDSKKAIRRYLEDLQLRHENGVRDADAAMTEGWRSDRAAGYVPTAKGQRFPVAVLVRSQQDVSPHFYRARAWVLQRDFRVATKGIRRKTRVANLQGVMLGPGVLSTDGSALLPRIRYAITPTASIHGPVNVGPLIDWFWEVRFRALPDAKDGRKQALLFVSSLSRSKDVICYGQELARMYAAFTWQVEKTDPNASFQTVLLCT